MHNMLHLHQFFRQLTNGPDSAGAAGAAGGVKLQGSADSSDGNSESSSDLLGGIVAGPSSSSGAGADRNSTSGPAGDEIERQVQMRTGAIPKTSKIAQQQQVRRRSRCISINVHFVTVLLSSVFSHMQFSQWILINDIRYIIHIVNLFVRYHREEPATGHRVAV